MQSRLSSPLAPLKRQLGEIRPPNNSTTRSSLVAITSVPVPTITASISLRPSSLVLPGSTDPPSTLTSTSDILSGATTAAFGLTTTGNNSLPPSSSSESTSTSLSTQSSIMSEPSTSSASPLNADELATVISSAVIVFLIILILGIMFWLRRREQTTPDPERESSGAHPVERDPAHSKAIKADLEILGKPAVTGPGRPGWPTENQVPIPLQPRPKRRTLSSDLSPFGYLVPAPGTAITTDAVRSMDGSVARKAAAGGRSTQSRASIGSGTGQYRPGSEIIGAAVYMPPPNPSTPLSPRPLPRPTSHPSAPPRPPRPPSLGTPMYT